MYCKLVMTCFKYQVYLYGSEAITYLNAIFEMLQSLDYESSDCPHPSTKGSPPPLCMVA